MTLTVMEHDLNEGMAGIEKTIAYALVIERGERASKGKTR